MTEYQIKRIELEGPQNVRDFGGFQMADGRRIKNGRLIRSCELARLTLNDMEKLRRQHHLHTIVDFRTGMERAQAPDPVIAGVKNIWLPILDEAMLGVTKEEGADQDMIQQLSVQIKSGQTTTEQFMKTMYQNIVLNEHAAGQYHQFFEILLSRREGAVLWHCSAGKDRAGMGALLVLLALGAPKELIIEDYLMVNVFLRQNIEENIQRVIRETGDAELAEAMSGLFMVERSYVEFIFMIMEQKYGSVEGYLEKMIGMTRADCLRLQDMYLG